MMRSPRDGTRLAYTTQEFADMTGIPYSTVAEKTRTGEWPSRKVGRRKYIPAQFAEEFFAKHAATG